MIAPFNRCVECSEIITEPICANCLVKEMKVMISEYDLKLANKITGFNMPGETSCITCGSKMGLCAFCFSKDVYSFLKEENVDIAKEFMRRFDYGLRREFG
jgi:hypothetical protein